MKSVVKYAALALAISFLSVGAVQAHDMGYECTEGVDYQMYAVGDADNGPLYVTIDEILSDDTTFSVWIYQETNGVDGLQRHDNYCYNAGVTGSNSDMIIF